MIDIRLIQALNFAARCLIFRHGESTGIKLRKRSKSRKVLGLEKEAMGQLNDLIYIAEVTLVQSNVFSTIGSYYHLSTGPSLLNKNLPSVPLASSSPFFPYFLLYVSVIFFPRVALCFIPLSGLIYRACMNYVTNDLTLCRY